MIKLWQLKKISTDEAQNDPQPLPENWGPIFGMEGFIDKLDDLSWLGEAYSDLGWFIVGEQPEPTTSSESVIAWEHAKQLLRESDWSILPDVPMLKEERARWIEYRQKLRDIRLQPGDLNDINWPLSPE